VSLTAAFPEGTTASSSSYSKAASSIFLSLLNLFLFLISYPSKFLVGFLSTVVKNKLYS
jgi:hypothetical protein